MNQATRWIGLLVFVVVCLGVGGVAGLAARRIQGGGETAHIVRSAAGPQYRMVVDLLRPASAGRGIRRDRHPVARDSGHDRSVFPLLEDRRLAAGALFGMGELRQPAQLHHLADEYGMIKGCRRVAVPLILPLTNQIPKSTRA